MEARKGKDVATGNVAEVRESAIPPVAVEAATSRGLCEDG